MRIAADFRSGASKMNGSSGVDEIEAPESIYLFRPALRDSLEVLHASLTRCDEA